MPIVDIGVYVAGRRTENPPTLGQTREHMSAPGSMAWIALVRATLDEVREVAAEFSLHPLAVDDALAGHQRAKLERFGDTLVAVLLTARYLDDTESVEFGELRVLLGTDVVITIRQGETPDLALVRRLLEGQPDLLALGPQAVLSAIFDEVVREYTPVMSGVENDIDEIEDALFGTGDVGLSRRIYDLSREVITFQRATQPLVTMIERLERGAAKSGIDEEIQRRVRSVYDHALRVNERIDGFRAILDNALALNATLVTQRQTETALVQNEQVKKISGWAAILFGPTLVGTIYGMNFRFMPELDWPLGYPFALAMMAATSVALYAVFKRRKWL